MWKVTRKGLLGHKFRFLLTGLSILLGVAFISGTFVFTATIQHTFDNLIANIYKNTDAQVRGPEAFKNDQGFGNSKRPPIPQSLQAVVAAAPGVAAAEGNVQLEYAQIVQANGKPIGTPGQGAPTLGFGWDTDPTLNSFHLIPGGQPPTKNDEIVIDKGTADQGHFAIGQQATVLTSKPPAKYTITGIARFGDADNLAGASVVLFTVPQAQKIADLVGQFNYINVRAKPGVSQTQVAESIRSVLPAGSNAEVVTGQKLIEENQSQIAKALGFLNKGLLIFGIVSLVVGAFIIYNTFSITVAQRSREMALLRAIGASRGQVLGSVVSEAVIVGLIASAVGVGAGVLLATGLRALMGALGIDLPGSGVVIPATAVIYGLLVGMVVTLVSAIVPARTAASVPPIAAMRDVALEKPLNRNRRLGVGLALLLVGAVALWYALFDGGSVYFLVGGAVGVFGGVFVLLPLYARGIALVLGAPIAKLRGIRGELARENVGRNPRRTATTSAALMIGVALIAFIAIFADSAKVSFASAITSQIRADYIVNSGGQFGGAGLSPQLGRQIAALPEIASSSPLRVGQGQVGKSVQIIGAFDPAAAELFDLNIVSGNLSTLSPNGIVISKKTADSKHWTVGTTVPVTFVKTGRTAMKVEAIYGVDNLTLPVNYLMSIAGYEKNFTEQLDVLIYAKLKPGVSAAQGQAALAPLLAKYPTAKLQDLASYKADQLSNLNQLLALVYGLLFFSVLIAAIGVIITLVLSVYERTREIGLLRAVGMSRKQLRSSIRWEAVLISLLGTFVGLVIGLFFGWALVLSLKNDGLNHFSPAAPTLIIVVIITFLLGIVAAVYPARRAAKLDVLQAISSV